MIIRRAFVKFARFFRFEQKMGQVVSVFYQQINQLIEAIKLMISQVSSPRLGPRRVSQGQKLEQQMPISQLHKTISASYSKLQQCYQSCTNKNEQYLLKVYLKVLDKMLDDLVYAQQKVNLVDCQFLKQQKCLKYVEEIAKYKNMVIQYKEKVEQKKQILSKEKQKTLNLEYQKNELIEVSKRKQIELQKVKSVLEKCKEEQKELKVMQKQQGKKIICTQRQRIILSEQQDDNELNPENKTKMQQERKINMLQLGINLKKRKQIAQLSKSLRFQIQNSNQLDSSDFKKLYENLQDFPHRPVPFPELKISSKKAPFNPNKAPNQNLSQTLWLYLPSSYRKNRSHWKQKIEEKEPVKMNNISLSKYQQGHKYQSQQSTKRSSQINKSNHQSEARKK